MQPMERPRRGRRYGRVIVAGVAMLSIAAAACGSDDKSDTTNATTATTTATTATAAAATTAAPATTTGGAATTVGATTTLAATSTTAKGETPKPGRRADDQWRGRGGQPVDAGEDGHQADRRPAGPVHHQRAVRQLHDLRLAKPRRHDRRPAEPVVEQRHERTRWPDRDATSAGSTTRRWTPTWRRRAANRTRPSARRRPRTSTGRSPSSATRIPLSWTIWATATKPDVRGMTEATAPDGAPVLEPGKTNSGGIIPTAALWVDKEQLTTQGGGAILAPPPNVVRHAPSVAILVAQPAAALTRTATWLRCRNRCDGRHRALDRAVCDHRSGGRDTMHSRGKLN